jgi:hypothetical protein
VIAQGWPLLGDISKIIPIVLNPATESKFQMEIKKLVVPTYDLDRAAKALWQLFKIKRGDLVVAIEGTRVRGITQARQSAVEAYSFDPNNRYDYRQCAGRDVNWIDWDERVAKPLTAPRKGVLAASRIHNDEQVVLEAWEKFAARNGRI